MKVTTIVRTRDNAEIIERFIMSYQNIADSILVADNESQDDTVSICKSLPKTQVRHFRERVYSTDSKVWRAPHGKHLNFLIDWATEEGADWIIMDDSDCIPNYQVKKKGRFIFDVHDELCDYIMINRVYFYKEEGYFETLTKPTGDFTPSLWAWRANKGIKAKEDDGWEHYVDIHLDGLVREDIAPPYCLLHYFYPNDEFMQKKLDFYRHMRPGIRDPKDFGGKLLPLEDWMRE